MKKYLLLLLLALPFVVYGASSVFQPFQGGTGTSTAPTYGQVLTGNSSGTYTALATSSLGITASINGTTGQVPYFSSTNNAVGTSSIFIDNTGDVGIGSTTPLYFLTVQKNQNNSTEASIANTTSGAASFAGLRFDTASQGMGGSLRAYSAGFTTSGDNIASSLQLRSFSASTGGLVLAAGAGGIHFRTNNTAEYLTVSNGGLVGVGTTSPAGTLGIAGAIFASSTTATSTFFGRGINLITAAGQVPCFAVNGTCVTSGSGSQTPWTSDIKGGGFNLTNVNTASSTVFRAGSGSGTNPSYTFDADTSTGFYRPAVNQLAIRNNGSNQIQLFTNAVSLGGTVSISGATSVLIGQVGSVTAPSYSFIGDQATGIYQPSTSALGFTTVSKERLRIDYAGRLGVGTTSPFSLLSVHTLASGTSTTLFSVASSTSNSTTTLFGITNTGHFFGTSTSPILSSCGTGPSVLGSDSHGTVTVGSTATGCTITFSTAYRSAPVCTVTNQSMSIVNAMTYTISSTALTVSQTGLGGAKIDYLCMEN